MGESDFVIDILSESEENFSRKYRLKGRGFNFEKVADRVSSLFDLEKDYITARGRQRDRVRVLIYKLERKEPQRAYIKMEKAKAYAVKPDTIDTDSPNTLINRELSWLGFARRVLALAEDPDQPQLERVKFAGIRGMRYDDFAM